MPEKDYYTIENFIKSEKDTEASTRFDIEIRSYFTKQGCWEVTWAVVTEKTTGKEVASVKRNYSQFWYSFEEHSNGSEYLLCGADYQGQTVVNLDMGKRYDNLPPEAKDGFGFCWASATAYGNKLAVEGCYWACPYELIIYDFSEPEQLPYKELARLDIENIHNLRWIDNNTIEYEISREFVALKDHPYYGKEVDTLPDEVEDALYELETSNKYNYNEIYESKEITKTVKLNIKELPHE